MNELQLAVRRLSMSRERLRLAIGPPVPPAHDAGTADHAGPGRQLDQAALREWLARRWHAHPLHTAGRAFAEAGDAVLAPFAQRHPIALVSVALLAGASLVALRPWRRIGLAGLLAAWLPSLLRPQPAAAAAPSMPWLGILAALMPRR